jgi:CPA1 family monovalent cation:H+ antiporter
MLLVTASLLLGRAVGVYLIGGVHNIFSDRNKIPIKWLHIVNWGGLRGVLPLVVALSLPESYQYREIFIQLVLFAIYFTLVINGITMEFIINVLGISKPNAANKFEIKISELIILQKLGKHIEKLRKIGEIGEKTYNKHKQEIGTILEHNQQQLKELLNSNPEEYDSEIEKVLKRYCLQVEKSSYKRLFDKEVLTETVYNRLRFCIDQQKDSISEGGEQFSEQENSFYKQIFERKDDWLRAAVMRLLPFENEKKLIEESYLYHKARLLANESVLDDLQDFKIVILNEKTEAVIADLVETYRKLMEKNQNILDRIVTEYRDISFAVDEKCFYCETQSLIGGIISEYGEDGRISKKALKNLELKL